jgi:DNA-binding response OmpR family regulator
VVFAATGSRRCGLTPTVKPAQDWNEQKELVLIKEETIEMGAVTGKLRALAQDMRLKILVVDDDELERFLIADRLEARGFEVAHAANGAEALAHLEGQPFPYPVILVDWQMPVMNGIELTQKLRASGMDESYIIMLSARDTSLDYEAGYRAGVDDYLTKKTRDPELIARIHAGLATFSLRHSLKEARAALAEALASKAAAA